MNIKEQQEHIYSKKWHEYQWNGEVLYPVMLPLKQVLWGMPYPGAPHMRFAPKRYNVIGTPRSGTKWMQKIVQMTTGGIATHGHMGVIGDFKPNHSVIFIYRDIRDCMLSDYFFIKHGGHCGAMDITSINFNKWGKDAGIAREIITYMKYRMPVMNYWFHVDAPNVIKVKYEDLVEDREAQFHIIAKKLNVNLSDKKLKNMRYETSFQRMSGGRKPGIEVRGRHQRKGVPGDWKNHFTEKHLEMFDQMGGNDFLKELGYDVD